jgi:hypothetical protein
MFGGRMFAAKTPVGSDETWPLFADESDMGTMVAASANSSTAGCSSWGNCYMCHRTDMG